MFWVIQHFPRCDFHIFLSHCAEDRDGLVHPADRALRGRGVRPWLDRHDYPYGRGSRAALRDAVLASRHVVFFVTDAMLASPRGWCVQELAWGELLQDNLVQSGGPSVTNVLLPLYFVSQTDPRLPRSVWQLGRDRGLFCPPTADRASWAVGQIVAFLSREERLAAEVRRLQKRDATFRSGLRTRSGLFDRATRFDPQPLPPSPPSGSPARPSA